MTGRPSRTAKRALIVAHVEAGSSRRAAAALAGVPFSTFYEWLEESRFADTLSAAEGTFEQRAVARIERAAGQGSWRAALALLERRLPNEWQPRSRLEVEGGFHGGEATAEERVMLRKIREQASQPHVEQVAEVHDLLSLMLDNAADDGDLAFVRTVHEQSERLLARAAMLARAAAS